MSPRIANRQSKPAVLHQTLEIPSASPATEETPKERETRPDFWTYMRSLTPEDWKDHIVYLTRERPKTHMNGVVGGYLTKIIEPFELDDIKDAYGGYEFSYIMKRGRDAIYNGRFTVEAPPKLDGQRESAAAAGENGGGNALVQQFVNMLREELERSRGAAGGDQTTTKAVEMLSKASEKAMDMIKQQVPEASNPTMQLKELLTVAKDLGVFPGAGGGGANNILETIKVLRELGIIGQAAMDPMKNLDSMLSIFTKIDEIRGSNGGRRRDWKETAIEKGLEYLPQVLDTFRETREANMRIANDRARAAEHLSRIQNPSARPAVASVMTPRPAGASPTAPAEPAIRANSGLRTVPIDRTIIDQPPADPGEPAAAVIDGEVVLETIDRNSPAFMNTVKLCVLEMVQRGDHGEQIVDFLDGAKPGFSNTLVDYTPEQLSDYFRLDPILRAAIELPNWPEVLDEARKYILDESADEEEPELETVPPAPPRKTRKPN